VIRYRIIWLDSRHRVIWRWIVWLDSGHRVTRHDRGHWVIRHWIVWLDSGHRVTRHQVIWLDSGHRVIRYRIVWLDSRHWVIRRDRIIRLDQFIRLGTDIRLKCGCRGTRLNHGRQAHRFGYWQDGIGWKEFPLFSGFNYWSTASKCRSANEWSSWRQRRTGGWNRGGSCCYRGLLYRVKERIGAASGSRGLVCGS
ncbi:unnamed protein product, partial [Staurois parvus]